MRRSEAGRVRGGAAAGRSEAAAGRAAKRHAARSTREPRAYALCVERRSGERRFERALVRERIDAGEQAFDESKIKPRIARDSSLDRKSVV